MSKLDAKAALAALREHFASVTNEEFLENLRKWAPEFFEDDEPTNAAPHVNGTAKTNDDIPRESV